MGGRVCMHIVPSSSPTLPSSSLLSQLEDKPFLQPLPQANSSIYTPLPPPYFLERRGGAEGVGRRSRRRRRPVERSRGDSYPGPVERSRGGRPSSEPCHVVVGANSGDPKLPASEKITICFSFAVHGALFRRVFRPTPAVHGQTETTAAKPFQHSSSKSLVPPPSKPAGHRKSTHKVSAGIEEEEDSAAPTTLKFFSGELRPPPP